MIKFLNIRCNNKENPECIDNIPVFSWNFESSYLRDVVQKSFVLEVRKATDCTSDEEEVVFCEQIQSDKMQYMYPLANLEPLTKYQWTVTVGFHNGMSITSPKQYFATGLMGREFSEYGAAWISGTQKYEESAVSFRKSFLIEKTVQSASAYIFGTAWQDVSINGKRLKDDCFFLPPNTRYQQKCVYEKYDLTDSLTIGENEVQVLLGAGYNSNYSQWGWRFFGGKAVIGFVEILFADGTGQRIVTDDSWEIYSSPIHYCDMYNGERYDANLVCEKLEQAVLANECVEPIKDAVFVADEMPQVRILREVQPVRCTKQGEDYLYDMGENFAGVAHISLIAPEGTKVSLQFSELVYANGEQRTTTNREAQARDEYICSGEGIEEYMPRFTYHGYRYVKVSGLTDQVEKFELVGIALSADVTSNSSFHCSDGVVNQIHENAVRSVRSNLMTIPTDCPMRNERTPCAMDSVCAETANIYNFDMHGYYNHWLDDILIATDEIEDHGNPDWDGDRIMLAYRMLRYYDDVSLAKKYYKCLKTYVQCLEDKTEDYLWYEGFGDWCHPNQNDWESFHGSVAVVNSCMFYAVASKMAVLAGVLEEADDETYYLELAKKIQAAFLDKFVNEDGTVREGTHTEQAMPLYVKLIPSGLEQNVFDRLFEKLHTEPMDLGIFGMTAVAEVLPRYGASDLLLQMLQNPNYPGFLYQIANGATSLWEQWAFDGRMHSHNHAMFAGIENAFYRGFAGIRPIENAFRTFEIRPNLPKQMNFLECSVETAYGIIDLKYRKDASGFEVRIHVPIGTEAELYLPNSGTEYEWYDGEVCLHEDCRCVGEDRTKLFIGSGQYSFRAVGKALLFDNSLENAYCFE